LVKVVVLVETTGLVVLTSLPFLPINEVLTDVTVLLPLEGLRGAIVFFAGAVLVVVVMVFLAGV
jgi:hypothetical protein